jgi:hypothetical protein
MEARDPLLRADLLEMAQTCELIALSSEGLAQRLYDMLNEIPGEPPAVSSDNSK